MSIRDDARQMKLSAPVLAASDIALRNHALELVKQALLEAKDAIFAANAADVQAAEEAGIASQLIKRLCFDEHKLNDVCLGIDQLIGLPDPLGVITLDRDLDEGLELRRISCPIGVIGVIFEARPDALVQISTLCIKSGNCAILKGGRETAKTNRCLFVLIHDAILKAGLPSACLMQAESHADIDELLGCDGDVDLLIPRGSNAFVRHIMDNTKIPVMGHADGICHSFVEQSADFNQALRVLIDAKTQYVVACNTTETVLVQRSIAKDFLPRLAAACGAAGVHLHGDDEVARYIQVKPLGADGYAHEYLALELSVKLVKNTEEAIEHINRYGSHHTDAILTRNESEANKFQQMVDSAGVYVNASTRFADGYRYGFGAEVGISTGKIHARGPVGLEGLVTYKYLLRGQNHIVSDYASGKRQFTHRDL
ncbi:glutamate-5-semialdehyde dehydrogenase [Olegusella massiliensis]|uniref:glutamate-5-semialdehyde dehydrogenase n=1 Tax=Olegusella massiliensis TaxID=1776381 RepID=UPI0008389C7B|nr:glutamate-5-semialdehyde dehydrogenase [Olegusella massiliensis]